MWAALPWAIAEAEPWTPLSLVAAILLLVAGVVAVIWAYRRSGRR
jgi:hypothetical protein